MENRQAKHRRTVDQIQNRLLGSQHGEFFVTSDFVLFRDALGRKPARRALKEIEKMGGVAEIHPGNWMVSLTGAALDELTPSQIDTALFNAANSLAALIKSMQVDTEKVQPIDHARLKALTSVIHSVKDYERVYIDHDAKELTPDTGLMLPKLSGMVTWNDGVPTGTIPEAQAYLTELQNICSAAKDNDNGKQ